MNPNGEQAFFALVVVPPVSLTALYICPYSHCHNLHPKKQPKEIDRQEGLENCGEKNNQRQAYQENRQGDQISLVLLEPFKPPKKANYQQDYKTDSYADTGQYPQKPMHKKGYNGLRYHIP